MHRGPEWAPLPEGVSTPSGRGRHPFRQGSPVGDRFHKEFLACREKADEVHSKISEMMKQVNETRDKLKMAREERESWITDHNASVTKEMKTGAEDEKVADSMVDHLLSAGSLTFGGTMAGDRAGVGTKKSRSDKKKSMRRVDMTSSRGRK